MTQTNEDVFEVKKRILKVKISESESYDLRYPSADEAFEYQEQMEKTSGLGIYKIVKDTLIKLGLPQEVIYKHFDTENLIALWERIAKKNF